jgi:hypothetical protein
MVEIHWISYLGFERFDPPRSERPSGKSEVSEFDMPSTVDQKVLGKNVKFGLGIDYVDLNLRFEIAVYITQLVQLVHGGKHLADIESSMFLFQNSRII